MGFYYSLFFILLLLALIGDSSLRNKTRGNNTAIYRIALLCISTVLIVITSIRYEVGTDYTAYIEEAQYMLKIPFKEAIFKYELFFVLFTKISYGLFGTMQFFYMVIAFVIIVPFALSINYMKESLFYVFLFFFVTTTFFISLNAMRQIAAFSIAFYAFVKYLRTDNKKFFLAIIIATFWHTSALIYLSIYFLDKINLNRVYILVLVSFIVFKVILNQLMISFIENTGLPLRYYFLAQEGSSSLMFIIISLIVFILFKFFVKRNDNKSNLFYNISLLNVGVAIFADGIPGAYRLMYIFYPFYCFICPYMIRNSRIKQKRIMAIVLFCLFAIYYYRQQILGNANEIVPYKSIL
ncbi:EpsG family protein [uncultured Draconibacterium sp.]|uniref:EpsG family protein n=1 Tax=uncultured Draconibacterium sp. TaxID=1573823 RepID=UPI002AA92AA9|nr:EpsG family protein [uncultured Draconibacterium sp.]